MALPGVIIDIQNGALPASAGGDDGLCGLILQGPAATGLALLTPTLINSLEEAIAFGISAEYDELNSVRVFHHLQLFYAVAGAGRSLWIMLVSQAVSLEAMADQTEANYARKILDAAEGKITILAITRSPLPIYVPDTEDNGIDADVIAAISNAQELAGRYEAEFTPIVVLLEGINYAGDAGSLVDLKERSDSNVVVLIGDTVAGQGAALGLLTGRLANVPVQRNPGRVLDGPLPADAVYIGESPLQEVFRTVDTIHDKGFVSFRQFRGRAGFYFSNDPTATNNQDDYRRIAYRRTINKAIRITYITFVSEILGEVEVNAAGQIELVKAKYYQALIERAVNQAMTSQEEILQFAAFIDPTVNVLAAGEICVEARIRPYGYADFIRVKLGFASTLNS